MKGVPLVLLSHVRLVVMSAFRADLCLACRVLLRRQDEDKSSSYVQLPQYADGESLARAPLVSARLLGPVVEPRKSR